jgi:hypothetical protein
MNITAFASICLCCIQHKMYIHYMNINLYQILHTFFLSLSEEVWVYAFVLFPLKEHKSRHYIFVSTEKERKTGAVAHEELCTADIYLPFQQLFILCTY